MNLLGVILTLIGAVAQAFTFVSFLRARRANALEGAAFLLVFGTSMFAVGFYDQRLFAWFMQEDRPAEWATFSSFVGAACLCTRSAYLAWVSEGRRSTAILWLLFALAWIFVAGEEISWGQRILGFTPPDVFLDRNVQLESNIHNLLTHAALGPIPLNSAFLVAVLALVLGVFGPLAGFLWKVLWSSLWRKRGSIDLSIFFAAPALRPVLIMIAGVQLWHPVGYGSEATELLLGLCALLIASGPRTTSSRPPRCSLLLLAPLILGALLSPLFNQTADDPERIAVARKEVIALTTDVRQILEPIMNGVLRYRAATFHSRVQWALRRLDVDYPLPSTFLQKQLPAHAGGAKHRRGYFLDPWSTPYWIYLDFTNRRLLLYSFGPNRRRDTRIQTEDYAQGDDVGVVLRWPPGTVEVEFSNDNGSPLTNY